MSIQVYKASAGSGKTFTLTLEFFKIIFASPLEYKNVLAVTFTNKATGEMKSRIVRELNKLAEGERSDYREELQQVLKLTDEQVKMRAELLRTLVLHDYGRLSVTTIDKFFQRVIKSFTKELGIFPGYNVELDSDYVLMRAVDQVMQRMAEDRDLRVWITELMDISVEDARSWNVKDKIAALGKELFGERYMLFEQEVKQHFNDREFLRAYRKFLRQIVDRFEQQLKAFGESACRMMADNALQVPDFKGGSRSFMNYFLKLRDGNLDKVSDTARVAVDDVEAWVTKKTDAAVRSRVEAVFPELNACLKDSIAYYDEHLREYNSARLLSDNLYQLGILQDLYREIRGYCEENGLMLLSDTTRMLNVLISGNDTSFLFEKTGNFYKHVMIDEFQDTSAMQWANFRPLVVNTLSEGGKAMVVGDVKQSIYRWRNGDWGLLANGVEREFSSWGVDNVLLKKNWRSCREIVTFNNLFFDQAAIQLRELYDEDCGEENPYSPSITEAYREQGQQVQKQREGYVEIRFGEEKKEEGSTENILQNVVDILQDTLARGGKMKDCVILVRDGKEGGMVADFLMEYNKTPGLQQPIPFISNDSLFVSASPGVSFIVNVLRYLTEPYDAVNRAVLLYNLQTFVREESGKESLNEVFKAAADPEQFLARVDIPLLRDAGKNTSASLFETVEQIIDVFGLKDKEEELPYLIAFQDIVFDYESSNTNSVAIFLEWWEKEKSKKVLSTSEEVDAVRILTIHKSKGLEFATVIIPFCDWDLDDTRHARRLWCVNQQEGFSDLGVAPLNYSSKLADSYFMDDYLEEHMKSYVDNLNLLYVALTRAERELYVLPYAPKISKEGKPSNIGAFLFQVLERLGKDERLQGWRPEEKLLVSGTREPFPAREEKNEDTTLSLAAYPVYGLQDRVSVRYRYEDYTDPETAEHSAVDEGKLLHEIFRRLETFSDVDQAVDDMYRTGLITGDERVRYREQVRVYLKDGVPSEWFDGTYRVINERDILLPGADKARPDRVLVQGDKAIVVDYKFGRKEEKGYLRQVGYYCKLLRQMGYRQVEGYIWYVSLSRIVTVAGGDKKSGRN